MINVSLPFCLSKEWAAGNKRQLLNYKIRLALEASAKRKWAELMDALGSLPCSSPCGMCLSTSL